MSFFKKTNSKVEFTSLTPFIPPPPPQKVIKISKMLNQVTTWIELGDAELAEEHWDLISKECSKFGTEAQEI